MKQQATSSMKSCVLLLIPVLILTSCSTSKGVAYFQDRPAEVFRQVTGPADVRVMPHDKLSVTVNCKDQLLTELFSLTVVSHRIGGATTLQGYTVSRQGEIDFPVLGNVHVEGRTREEVAALIKKSLIDKNLVKDPVVTVEFMNLAISVLGEVSKPGRFNIDRDRITLLDAIGMAGDLTIYGKREAVRVLREENGKQMTYFVNLCSLQETLDSPAYYLRQNDVVYVEPNEMRARQSTVNGNNIRSASFWMSLASLLTTITVLIVK